MKERPVGGPARNLVTVALIGLIFTVVVGWDGTGYAADSPGAPEPDPAAMNGDTQKRAVHLYFGDASGQQLIAEQRVLMPAGDDVSLSRELIEALIEGPRRAGTRTLPKGAVLRALYILSDGFAGNGMAVVDFDAESFRDHPGGVEAEMLSIYSLVNTLAFNIDSIRQVMILIGGREAATLAGHVDLSRPFRADMMWVR
jgi:spore germination protein GerM